MPSILLVEDSDSSRLEVKKILLAEMDVEIFEACNGQEGLEAYEKNEFDLIITDINMPRMDGIEMCRRIVAVEGKPTPPIIALSSDSVGSLKKEGKTVGIVAWVVKPIREQLFVSGIKSFLEKGIK